MRKNEDGKWKVNCLEKPYEKSILAVFSNCLQNFFILSSNKPLFTVI